MFLRRSPRRSVCRRVIIPRHHDCDKYARRRQPRLFSANNSRLSVRSTNQLPRDPTTRERIEATALLVEVNISRGRNGSVTRDRNYKSAFRDIYDAKNFFLICDAFNLTSTVVIRLSCINIFVNRAVQIWHMHVDDFSKRKIFHHQWRSQRGGLEG